MDGLLQDIQKGLLQWYDFSSGGAVLYIGCHEDALASLFRELRLEVTYASCVDSCDLEWRKKYVSHFDFIVSVEALERELDPSATLRAWKPLLKPDGRLLLGMNNRLGLRYFCGDRDPYTERNFDGVENYRHAYVKQEDTFRGRCYDQAALKRVLRKAGWDCFQFFSVCPDLRNPSLILAEDYLPNENLTSRVTPSYNYPYTVFLEEEGLYNSLIENGMFHQMANAYLIECSLNGQLSDVNQVTSSTDRGRARALFTVIHKSGIVEKRTAYPKEAVRLEKLAEHNQDLAAHGISVVNGRVENGAYIMPFIKEEVGQIYLERLFWGDRAAFFKELDHFRDLILQSSDTVQPDCGDGQGAVLRYGYLDMVPLNSFHIGKTFVFYDQEFREENYPANAIIFRMLATFYAWNLELGKSLPIDILFDRYNLTKYLDKWREMEWKFLAELRNEKKLWTYHEMHRRNGELVHSNRQHINYSYEDYQRLFVDIFRHADTRKLVLFGSGLFAKKFLALYGNDYPVYAVIDNDQSKWGQQLEGIPIQPPGILKDLHSGEYKVLICIKNYLSVMKQLEAMDVVEYSVFDTSKDYPRKRKRLIQETETAARKRYHVGYISGVFDLFHVGHLNMFKRAKDQCDYLIVGVVTDEGVRKYKKTEPIVPFTERLELVRSCRYVDEAVDIPLDYRGPRDAWRLHHFDCQFCGSDYADNPNWLSDKEFLERHGAELVFFPYTEGTSSSKIKKMIEKKLLIGDSGLLS